MPRSVAGRVPDMASSVPRVAGAGAGALPWPSVATACSCRDCEMVRRQDAVLDLLAELDEPASLARLPGRMGSTLRCLLVDAVAWVGGAAGRLARPSPDDWDPY